MNASSSNIFTSNSEVNAAINTFLHTFESQNRVHTTKHQLEDNITKGENNYCSVISRFQFEYEKDGNQIQKSVLLKIPSLCPNYDHMKLTNVYKKEIYMYENVFPHIYELWSKDYFTPAVYNTISESGILIMEDLSKDGYMTKDKIMMLDFDHSLIALQALAEFHAVSFKYLQHKNINDFPDLMRQGSEMSSSFQKYIDSMYDQFIETVSSSVSQTILDKLRNYKATFWSNSKKMMSPDEKRLNVLIHGDFWTGNILFKYDENGRICNSKILDWQICRIGCPTVDLIYFFAVSPQFEVFETKREIFLDSYLEKFNDTLAKLKCDFEYTREELNENIAEYKFLYLNMVSVALRLVFNTTGELEMVKMNQFTNMYETLVVKWLTYFEAENII